MCDACATYFLTPAGWVLAGEAPADAVAKNTFHEPMKMYETAWWGGVEAISPDADLVKRLTAEHGRDPSRKRRAKEK